MQPIHDFLSRYQKIIFLILTILTGVLILLPIHNFQAPLAQGDHGRELYAFWQTSHGATPYQDYWWCYGPLMPYYYGSIFKVLGPLAQTALLGETLLNLASVILCYFALSRFIQTGWAFLGAVWLVAFIPHFPHTYNHAGGIAALFWTILNLFLYIKTENKKFLWLGFLSISITFLIKFNIGIYSFTGFLACALLSDILDKKIKTNLRIYLYGSLLTTAALLFLHLWLIRDLPMYYILQCFPFLGGYRQIASDSSLLANMISFAKNSFYQIISYKPFLAVFILAVDFFLFGTLLWIKTKDALWRKTFLAILSAALFFLLCLHEHLASPMIYSKYWAEPFQALLIFLVIGSMVQKTPKILQVALILFFCGVILARINIQHRFVQIFKNPLHHFQTSGNDIYATNAPDWFLIVNQTVFSLSSLLSKDETFFALPYEPLYYFLTKRPSPTKELCFFDFMHIPLDQEKDVILNLEKKRVRYVVLSNRCDSPTEPSIGTFGKTYGTLLSSYLAKNFEVIESFGGWGYPVGWIDNHATKILRRKSFLIPR